MLRNAFGGLEWQAAALQKISRLFSIAWPPRTAAASAIVRKARNQEARTEIPGEAHFLSCPLHVGDVECPSHPWVYVLTTTYLW